VVGGFVKSGEAGRGTLSAPRKLDCLGGQAPCGDCYMWAGKGISRGEGEIFCAAEGALAASARACWPYVGAGSPAISQRGIAGKL